LDVARLDHLGQQSIHGPDGNAESPRQRPLRDIRGALQLDNKQLNKLAIRLFSDALQTARSCVFEQRRLRLASGSHHEPLFDDRTSLPKKEIASAVEEVIRC